jgi:hypothetical protein
MRSLTVLLPVGVLALALAPAARADLVLLNPSKDNTLIQQTNPATQLSNGLGDIFVGRTNQDGQGPATISIRRGLVAFDIAGAIPAGSTINSVTLTMRDVMGLNGDRNTTIHRVLADWGEGTSLFNGGQGGPATTGDATWLYRFDDATTPAASIPWGTAGGDFVSAVSSEVIVSDDLGGGQTFTWTSTGYAQFVTDVQNWLDNPSSNFGWLLRGVETAGQTAKRLNSGESAFSPVLTIDFTPAVVPEPSTWFLLGVAGAIAGVHRVRRRLAA